MESKLVRRLLWVESAGVTGVMGVIGVVGVMGCGPSGGRDEDAVVILKLVGIRRRRSDREETRLLFRLFMMPPLLPSLPEVKVEVEVEGRNREMTR